MRSRNKLTGKWIPSDEVIKKLSLEYHVSENMPPVYLVACTDDPKVKVENSIRAYKALIEKNKDVTFVQYDKGGHGFGMMKKSFMESTHWNEALADWLKARNFMNYFLNKIIQNKKDDVYYRFSKSFWNLQELQHRYGACT